MVGRLITLCAVRPTGHLPFGHGSKKRDGRGNAGGGSLWLGRSLTAGRLVCDTYLSAREYMRMTTYDLGSLSMKLLKVRPVWRE